MEINALICACFVSKLLFPWLLAKALPLTRNGWMLLQLLTLYDRFGRLMMGSLDQPRDILEYVTFERHLIDPYGKWRIHGKKLVENRNQDVHEKVSVSWIQDYFPRLFLTWNAWIFRHQSRISRSSLERSLEVSFPSVSVLLCPRRVGASLVQRRRSRSPPQYIQAKHNLFLVAAWNPVNEGNISTD